MLTSSSTGPPSQVEREGAVNEYPRVTVVRYVARRRERERWEKRTGAFSGQGALCKEGGPID
jgi:hypothetical protein